MTTPTQETCPYGQNGCNDAALCTCALPKPQRAELLTRDDLDRIRRDLRGRHTLEAEWAEMLLQHIAALQSQLDAAKRENDFLRAYTGNSAKACVYCGLGADEQGKCTSGFPGCARGDDQMLCREVAVGVERDELRKEVAALTQRVEELTGALLGLEELYARDGESNNDRFERVADLYYRETGRLAPGKDSSAAAYDEESYDRRVAHWEDWYAKRAAKARAALPQEPRDG